MLLSRRIRFGLLVAVAMVAGFLLLPETGLAAAATTSLVDLNTASPQELEALKGVGPALSKKIIAARPYASVEELSKAGLSAKQIEGLKPLVTVSGEKGAGAAAAAPEKPGKAAEASRLIDLNNASRAELETLPGIGKISADKIIAGRPYSTVEDLKKAGIPEKNISVLKPLVTITPMKAEAKAETPKKPGVPAAAPGLIDLNKASQLEIEFLPGVGKSAARKIIANRPYASVDDLAKAGLSPKLIAELKPQVTVSAVPAAPAPEKPAPKAAPAAAPSAAPAQEKAPGKAAAAKLAPGQKVNLNTASKEMLEALPEIGPVKAQAIIENRPYKKIEDLMKVKGIKEGTFNAIKDQIVVE